MGKDENRFLFIFNSLEPHQLSIESIEWRDLEEKIHSFFSLPLDNLSRNDQSEIPLESPILNALEKHFNWSHANSSKLKILSVHLSTQEEAMSEFLSQKNNSKKWKGIILFTTHISSGTSKRSQTMEFNFSKDKYQRSNGIVWRNSFSDSIKISIHSKKLNNFYLNEFLFLNEFDRHFYIWDRESHFFSLSPELHRLEKIYQSLDILEKAALRDPLTHIFNFRFFQHQFEIELERTRRQKTHLNLLIVDIDHFKEINDQLGHLEGNQKLIQVTQLIKSRLRSTDWFFRYAGDEFIILLPNTDELPAFEVADRIRQLIQNRIESTTISIGMISISPDSLDHIPKNEWKNFFFEKADHALYEAKFRGRNQVFKTSLK